MAMGKLEVLSEQQVVDCNHEVMRLRATLHRHQSYQPLPRWSTRSMSRFSKAGTRAASPAPPGLGATRSLYHASLLWIRCCLLRLVHELQGKTRDPYIPDVLELHEQEQHVCWLLCSTPMAGG